MSDITKTRVCASPSTLVTYISAKYQPSSTSHKHARDACDDDTRARKRARTDGDVIVLASTHHSNSDSHTDAETHPFDALITLARALLQRWKSNYQREQQRM